MTTLALTFAPFALPFVVLFIRVVSMTLEEVVDSGGHTVVR
jgi:hypothetical protein